MAIRYDKGTGDYIINGFAAGVADDPYTGIADMRNANIISVPGEASVNFSTTVITQSPSSGSVSSANAGADTVTITGAVFTFGDGTGTAVTFAGGGLGGSGIVAGTVYWLKFVSAGVYNLYTDFRLTALLDITGNATGTWATINIGLITKFTYWQDIPVYFALDINGRVWSTYENGVLGVWTYMGNLPNNYSAGQGLVLYESSANVPYLFIFSNSSIDFINLNSLVVSYQWSPSAGTVGAWNATPAQVLKAPASGSSLYSHDAILAPDNKVYFCDTNWIGRFYQANPLVAFVPTTLATYTFDQTRVLPFNDVAQCLAPSGNNLLIGGAKNILYPWDTVGQLPSYPIFIPEFNVQQLVTVNTNTFIFVGTRGRIYVTNGSNAQLYKKIPDFISGTIEPYYKWGGACSNKNQLYFSALVTTNGGVTNTQYGGVWAIDLDTKAIRLTNKLSYNTYGGYASAIFPALSSIFALATPLGTGLFIGWYDGVSAYGIDNTTGNPYSAGETTIDSDLIPIGTNLQPTTNGRVEFKLSVPIVAGESVQLLYRQKFSDAFTAITDGTFSTAGTYSGVCQGVNFQESQWLQIRATLTSTSSSPSYVRLTELRVGSA